MEEWHEKELSFQGTHKLCLYIKDELQIINKSMLDDFTSHITVAGATFLINVGQQRYYFRGCSKGSANLKILALPAFYLIHCSYYYAVHQIQKITFLQTKSH